MTAYDLIVLGAGNAGQAAAGAARKAGWTVAIVEPREVGGVCPNRGCVPKKVLVAAAAALDGIQRADQHHIDVARPTLDWTALMKRKQSFVDPLPGAMEASLKRRGIDLYRGHGSFVGPRAIEMEGTRLEAQHVVIATGSRPRPLTLPGSEHLLTSEEFLQLTEVPKRAVFVGAGVIAFEFAHVLARLGSTVTLLEVMPQPLGRNDVDLVAQLLAHSRSLGIDVQVGVSVNAIEKDGEELSVQYTNAEGTHRLSADGVFNGAGRVPNLDQINIGAAGITLERGRPQVSAHLQSKENSAVWFAGDALPATPQLSPVATYEGRIVGHNLLNPDDLQQPDYSTLPSAVYTIPGLATVGLTEAQAKASGLDVEVRITDMREWLSARTYAEPVAWAKVLVDRSADRVVGAHLLGHGAPEVIHTFALAMRHQIPASELSSGLFAYPTFTNDAKYLV